MEVLLRLDQTTGIEVVVMRSTASTWILIPLMDYGKRHEITGMYFVCNY